MAFSAGVATSKADFIDQLTTFAAANGWTLDEFDASLQQASIHLNSIYVHFRWDASAHIAVFQSLDFAQEAASAVVSAGGSGYNVNDTLTVSGGTFETAAVFNVDSVDGGGGVTGVSLIGGGYYTATPSNPASTTGGAGTGATLTVTYQGVGPDEHPDDSGNGDNSGTISVERRLSDVGAGPYTNHWFFSGDDGGADYLYAVLEYSPGEFRLFGAGEMVKFGTWTGGEWCGATKNEQNFNTDDSRHNYMLDGRIQDDLEAATVHVEGLPGEGASEKWGVVGNFTPSQTGTDGNNEARESLAGGAREGWLNHALQGMVANPNSGFIPMIPYLVWQRTGSAGDDWRFLGKIPHIRELNGKQLVPGEEFTIGGSETWKVFPYTRKASSGEPHSGNAFFALRKIT